MPAYPPEVGLYAAPLALLGYAIFGRSMVLVVAASSTAALSASVIADLNADGRTDTAVSLSAALALFTGGALLAVGLMRVGWVATFMSKTVLERLRTSGVLEDLGEERVFPRVEDATVVGR